MTMINITKKVRVKVVEARYAIPDRDADGLCEFLNERGVEGNAIHFLGCNTRLPTYYESRDIDRNTPEQMELDLNYDELSKAEAETAIKSLFRNLNMMGNEKIISEAFVDHLGHEHRTLQQGFFRDVLIPVLQFFKMQNDEGWKDLRNEASCEAAAKMLEAVTDKDGDGPYLPFV